MPDPLRTLWNAGLKVKLLPDGGIAACPRALVGEWIEFIRENRDEIASLLEREQEFDEAALSVPPWPAILGPGLWRETRAPPWAPEDLTGWRRWFEGPNGEICSVT